jgi:hypothetical protein
VNKCPSGGGYGKSRAQPSPLLISDSLLVTFVVSVLVVCKLELAPDLVHPETGERLLVAVTVLVIALIFRVVVVNAVLVVRVVVVIATAAIGRVGPFFHLGRGGDREGGEGVRDHSST